jgi:hypothetical protein
VLDALLGIGPFFMPENEDRFVAEPAQATDDGFIFGKITVAREWREILDKTADEVERVRAFGMPRDERLLPGRQPRIGIDSAALDFCSSLAISSAIWGPLPSVCRALSSATLFSSSKIGFSKSR